MDRFCVRPGCASSAVAVLTYDYAVRTVWLDELHEPLAPSHWGMCATHADGLRPPMGWARVDRRTPIIPIRPRLAV